MILKSSTIVRDSENSEKRQVCQASPNLMSPALLPLFRGNITQTP